MRASVALANAQKEAAELRAKLGSSANCATDGEQPKCDADGDADMEQHTRVADSECRMGGDACDGLARISDEKLATIVKIVSRKVGMPGREAFLAEHKRRQDAEAACTPPPVRVQQGTEEWRKAEAKAEKAEAAPQAATAAVEEAKINAEKTLAALTAKAETTAKRLEDTRSAAMAARAAVGQAIAADSMATKTDNASPAPAVAFHPGSRAWEAASAMCGFLTVGVLAALAAAGMPPEQLALVQAAQSDLRKLAASVAAPNQAADLTDPVSQSPG